MKGSYTFSVLLYGFFTILLLILMMIAEIQGIPPTEFLLYILKN